MLLTDKTTIGTIGHPPPPFFYWGFLFLDLEKNVTGAGLKFIIIIIVKYVFLLLQGTGDIWLLTMAVPSAVAVAGGS